MIWHGWLKNLHLDLENHLRVSFFRGTGIAMLDRRASPRSLWGVPYRSFCISNVLTYCNSARFWSVKHHTPKWIQMEVIIGCSTLPDVTSTGNMFLKMPHCWTLWVVIPLLLVGWCWSGTFHHPCRCTSVCTCCSKSRLLLAWFNNVYIMVTSCVYILQAVDICWLLDFGMQTRTKYCNYTTWPSLVENMPAIEMW